MANVLGWGMAHPKPPLSFVHARRDPKKSLVHANDLLT